MLQFHASRDALWVGQTLGGDQHAFARLVERYSGVVFGIAMAHLRNRSDAEDITQDVFLCAYRALDTLKDRGRFGRWLTVMTRNRCLNVLQRQSRRVLASEQLQRDARPVVPRPEREELHRLLRGQIDDLPPETREILLLRYFSGKKVRELAKLLGISRSAAAKRLQRAREVLGARLVDLIGEEMGHDREDASRNRRILNAAVLVTPAWHAQEAAAGGSVGVATLWASSVGALAAKPGIAVSAVVVVAVAGYVAVTTRGNPPRQAPHPRTEVQSASSTDPATNEGREQTRPSAQPAPTGKDSAVLAQAPEGPAAGAVSGVVLDESGLPLADARVSARSTPMSYETVMTDANGAFQLEGMAPSTQLYVMAQWKPGGYKPGSSGASLLISPPVGPLRLTKAGLSDLEVVVCSTGSIAGRLLYEDGRPVPDMSVRAGSATTDVLRPFPARTDHTGHFKVMGCTADTYLLFAHPDFITSYSHDTRLEEVTLAKGQHLTGLTLVYQEWVKAKGRTVDTLGKPVADAEVIAVLGDFSQTRSDAAGRFEVAARIGTSLGLLARHPSYAQLRQNVEVDGTEIELVLHERETLRGRVVDQKTGMPVPDFEVMHLGCGALVEFKRFVDRFAPVHDEEGRFEVQPEHEECVSVGIRAEGYSAKVEQVDRDRWGEEWVVALAPGNLVEGRVVDEEGHGVADAKLYLGQLPYGYQLAKDEKALVAKSNSSGAFTIRTAPGGAQLLYAWHPDYAPKWVAIHPPQQEPVTIQLNTGCTLSGRMSIAGIPRRGVVNLFYTYPVIVGVDAAAGEEGTYEFLGLAPGEADAMVGVQYPETQSEWRMEKRATLRESEAAVVDFDFPEADETALSGGVSLHGAAPQNAVVNLYVIFEDGSRMQALARPDSEGRYTFSFVPPGPVVAQVFASGMDGISWKDEVTLNLVPGEMTVHDFALGTATGALRGEVAGVTAGELTRVRVYRGAWDVVLDDPPMMPFTRKRLAPGTSAFEFEHLAPGTYTVLATATSGAPTTVEAWRAGTRRACQIIEIGEDGETALTLVLP